MFSSFDVLRYSAADIGFINPSSAKLRVSTHSLLPPHGVALIYPCALAPTVAVGSHLCIVG